jgi:glycerol-3-phosphate acyltransferase PlsX
MNKITISIDAMGGDHGLKTVIPGALMSLGKHENLHLVLVGDEYAIRDALNRSYMKFENRITVQHASQSVGMDESPSKALRNKKDSSMRVAIDWVKEGKAEACVSAGNTGALMATARFVLKMLPGLDRPAIISTIPANNSRRRVSILDIGANVDTSAEHLFQFAVMGSVLTKALDNIEKPKVGLLNIGEEEIKGNDCVKLAARMLEACPAINYIGYVEGDGIFLDDVDVVVCDGFVGNVALKTMEGMAKLISRIIKESFNRNFLTKVAGVIAYLVLKTLKKRLNPEHYNGATLIGLKGIVVKSHGGTSPYGFSKAIECAMHEVERNVPKLIENEVAKICEIAE